MNIWFRIKDKLITPSLSDSILAGITRDSIIKLARDNKIEVEEKKISVQEILEAYNNNQLQEAFGTGTAVTISPINSITYKDTIIQLPKQKNPISLELKKIFQDIQRGRIEDRYSWIDKIDGNNVMNKY